jgi:hypothetical protein
MREGEVSCVGEDGETTEGAAGETLVVVRVDGGKRESALCHKRNGGGRGRGAHLALAC